MPVALPQMTRRDHRKLKANSYRTKLCILFGWRFRFLIPYQKIKKQPAGGLKRLSRKAVLVGLGEIRTRDQRITSPLISSNRPSHKGTVLSVSAE